MDGRTDREGGSVGGRRALRRARARLAEGIANSTFFDTAWWAKSFERAWFLMWDTYQVTHVYI